jgi:hypothetical protein
VFFKTPRRRRLYSPAPYGTEGLLGYGLNDPGFESRQVATFFSFPYRPHRIWNPSRMLLNGCRNTSPGTQRPERDVDHLPPNATVNNGWSCIKFVPVWRVGMEMDNVTNLLRVAPREAG